MLREFERDILNQTYELAKSGRRAPERLDLPLEPTWSAIIANEETVLASELFLPGDSEDAVRRAWEKIKDRADPADLTLYMSIEPIATYQRLPPVTESIRATGINMVVVGTENSFARLKGKGLDSLRKYGLDVVLADGEEGRKCQVLYEDYGQVANRFLPALKVAWRIESSGDEFTIRPYSGKVPVHYDAQIVELSTIYHRNFSGPRSEWLAILDRFAGLPLDNPIVQSRADRSIVFVGDDPEIAAKRDALIDTGIHVCTVPFIGEGLDLAHVMRQMCTLGFFSVMSFEGNDFWLRSIESKLLKKAICRVEVPYQSTQTLVYLAESLISLDRLGRSVRLKHPHLLQKESDKQFWIEASLEMEA